MKNAPVIQRIYEKNSVPASPPSVERKQLRKVEIGELEENLRINL